MISIEKAQKAYEKRIGVRARKKKIGIKFTMSDNAKKAKYMELIYDSYKYGSRKYQE